MAKGEQAKNSVIAKIQEAFGENYITYQDKKVYVWAIENGERLQVALSLTCPKTYVGDIPASKAGGIDFSMDELTPKENQTVEFTQEEQDNIDKLLRQFNL